MTHQRLREKAQAVIAARSMDAHLLERARLIYVFTEEATPEKILSILAELTAARKDAERYRWLRNLFDVDMDYLDDPRLMLNIQATAYDHDKPVTIIIDETIDAALNADGEKGE